jgi:hypothetical protein
MVIYSAWPAPLLLSDYGWALLRRRCVVNHMFGLREVGALPLGCADRM